MAPEVSLSSAGIMEEIQKQILLPSGNAGILMSTVC